MVRPARYSPEVISSRSSTTHPCLISPFTGGLWKRHYPVRTTVTLDRDASQGLQSQARPTIVASSQLWAEIAEIGMAHKTLAEISFLAALKSRYRACLWIRPPPGAEWKLDGQDTTNSAAHPICGPLLWIRALPDPLLIQEEDMPLQSNRRDCSNDSDITALPEGMCMEQQ
jgi:hypothetical protein